MSASLTIRPLRESDLAAADQLFRLAFGTWFQLPDPMQFRGDALLFAPRWRTYRDSGLVAEQDGEMVGLTFASRWGSLGVLGPVAIHPKMWRQGLARAMMPETLAIFERWQTKLVGLFTFPQSPTHLRLYQEFGFWPRHFVSVMGKAVAASTPSGGALLLSETGDRPARVAACRALTDGIFPGLDLTAEIDAVLDQRLGDVVVLEAGSRIDGFAICHTGAGSEGGSKSCYVKFAAARPGDGAAERLKRLIAACEHFAQTRGVAQLGLGASTGRHHAYRLLVELGFRQQLLGVMMHRAWQDGYDRPDDFVIDDWR